MAENKSSISVPVSAALRPYFAIEVESERDAPMDRFGGWWAAVWASALPCVQLGVADGYPVGRALRVDGEGSEGVRREVLEQASFFVTTREASLELAREAGVPTLFAASGDARVDQVPAICADFPGCKVLRSSTAFRRDLLLQDLQREFERLAPGILRRDIGESTRCRERLRPYLAGRVADLGHGGCKILPDAVGVDFFKYDDDDWIGDVRDLYFFAAQSFDAVYSSHCLEDLWDPRQALEEWSRILKVGGHLSLYLPLRDFYPNVGCEGANPGHKDDYVPEDVEGFARDLGHLDVVRSERFESEDSFEVILRKRAGRSYFLRSQGPAAAPQVSVLIVAGVDDNADLESRKLRVTLESTEASLAGMPHETLVLLRKRPAIEDYARLRELALLHQSVRIIEDRSPLTYPMRLARLAREARSALALHISPGTVATGSSLVDLVAAHGRKGGAVHARAVAIDGLELDREDAALSALCLETSVLTDARFAASPYLTPLVLTAALSEHGIARPIDTWVVAGGISSLPDRGRAFSQIAFDRSLLARSRPAQATFATSEQRERVLFVILRTFGDAILATAALDAFARAHPHASIDVLTEAPHAWLFAGHDAVDRVRTTGTCAQRLAEEVAIHSALFGSSGPEDAPTYDRFVLLSTRLDDVTYCDAAGLRLADFYMARAGLPEQRGSAPVVQLPARALDARAALFDRLALRSPYAVLHTKAGWASKSLTPQQGSAIAERLCRHGLAVLVVGAEGEVVDHPAAIQLAGTLLPEESAAVIAGATCYVGPDSGCLHLASAFGIPSLALYAGSHPWIAPPLADGSTSLLSFTSCQRPCGRSCANQSCDMRGITDEELDAAVDTLVLRARGSLLPEGDPALHDVRCHGAAVAWIDGPDGPERLAATPCAPPVFDLASRTQRTASVAKHLAPTEAVPTYDPTTVVERIRAAMRRPATATRARVHHAPAIEARLSDFDRRSFFDACIVMAAHAVTLECADLAASWLERAALHLEATITGKNGRPRPAYRAWLDTACAFSLTVPADRTTSRAALMSRALSFWLEHFGEVLDARSLLGLGKYVGESSGRVRDTLIGILVKADVTEFSLGTLQRHASLLVSLDQHEQAIELLRARRLCINDRVHRAHLAWDEAVLLLADKEGGRAWHASLSEVLDEAALHHDSEPTRSLAKRLILAMPPAPMTNARSQAPSAEAGEPAVVLPSPHLQGV